MAPTPPRPDSDAIQSAIVRQYVRNADAAIRAVREMMEQRKITATAEALKELLDFDPASEALKTLANTMARYWFAQAERTSTDRLASLSELLYAARLVEPSHAGARKVAEKLAAPAVRSLKAVLKAGNNEMILDSALAVLVLDPHQADALFAVSHVLMETGRAADAIEPLQRLTWAEPANGWYWLNLGRAHHRAGDMLAAADTYVRVIEAGPNTSPADKARISAAQVATNLMRQGQQALGRHEFDQATRCFTAVNRIDPKAEGAIAALKDIESQRAALSEAG